jgi:hypothetical protein
MPSNRIVTFLVAFYSLFSLTRPVLADFYLYSGAPYDTYWYVFGEHPRDCDTVWRAKAYLEKRDVSGNKYGVVCDDDNDHNGCNYYLGKPTRNQINRIEMKVDFGHYTWYRDWDGRPLVDVDNYQVGTCKVVDEHHISCPKPVFSLRDILEALWCQTDIGTDGGPGRRALAGNVTAELGDLVSLGEGLPTEHIIRLI